MCREICHFVSKKAQKGQQVHFKTVKKLRKRSGFVIYSWHFKESAACTVVERDANFYTWCVKGVSFISRRYTKGGTFLSKTVYRRVIKGSNLGVEPPRIPFLWYPRDVVNSWRSPKNARLRGRPNVPYYRKLTLHEIKVLETNANLMANDFRIKKINAKEEVEFHDKGN